MADVIVRVLGQGAIGDPAQINDETTPSVPPERIDGLLVLHAAQLPPGRPHDAGCGSVRAIGHAAGEDGATLICNDDPGL